MKVNYAFVTGDHSEIEVDEDWADVLSELDRLEYNVNRKETRRHCSLDGMDYKGGIFADGNDTFDELFDDPSTAERIHTAISKLKPQQQALVNTIYFEGKSVNDYATEEGVNRTAISHRLKTAKNNLKKLL